MGLLGTLLGLGLLGMRSIWRFVASNIAESWATFYGLQIAWELGYRRVQLELDSFVVYNFLNSELELHHPCYPIIWQCRSLLAEDWVVLVKHMFTGRETE